MKGVSIPSWEKKEQISQHTCAFCCCKLRTVWRHHIPVHMLWWTGPVSSSRSVLLKSSSTSFFSIIWSIFPFISTSHNNSYTSHKSDDYKEISFLSLKRVAASANVLVLCSSINETPTSILASIRSYSGTADFRTIRLLKYTFFVVLCCSCRMHRSQCN